jgi:hypothetical protein
MRVFIPYFSHNTFPRVKRYVMEPNVFLGYLERGNACLLNLFGHEQYPFNSLDQNNLAHGVYNVAQWGHYIPSRFLVWLCNTPQSFKRYVMEPNVFLGYLAKGTIGVE